MVTILPRTAWTPYTRNTGTMNLLALAISINNGISLGAAKDLLIDSLATTRNLTGGDWTPWKGGVFVHHAGPGSVDSTDCEKCRQEIADIWASHHREYGNIAYNFIVCQHGNIFKAQGYIRGEANGGYAEGTKQGPHPNPAMKDRHIWVDGYGQVGRNEAFYSILGLLRANDEPTAAMRSSIKDLVWHLRTEVSDNRRAGNLLYPHQHDAGYTVCPGNLTPYCNDGSLDPGVGVVPGPAINVISREHWGARPPTSTVYVPLSSRTGFCVHYSAGPPSQTVRQIQNYHMDGRGWPDIGYNFLVHQQGWIYEGRGWTNVGAHARGYNTTHIGVCFIGSDGDATQAAKTAIRSLFFKAQELCGGDLSATYHSALGSTSCPGNDLRTWVQSGMGGEYVPIEITPPPSAGSGRSDVRSVEAQQHAVNALGYQPPLTVDGVFGPLTLAGVQWLQRTVGVEDDGLWGPLTEAAFGAYIGIGGSGGGRSDVRTIRAQQVAVNGMGHSPALVTDGVYGPLTKEGVEWLQGRLGVTADGLWGPQTERAYMDHAGDGGWSGGANTTIRTVTQQQTAVNSLGYSPALVVDGVFGPLTYDGVRWLQDRVGALVDGLWGPNTESCYNAYANGEGLVVDGVFGARTIAALQRAIGAEPDGVWGPESKRALQRHLNQVTDADLVVDGAIGAASVRAMQEHLNTMTGAGLDVDGVWGAGTTRALQRALNLERF
ncbi:peptidoglycan-binding protein [Streptomyces sp. TRM72054]|uniref:peptidoglycan-binding protein n=1 Tax=Streptomyces sp. TRM72054 TaxID=2870562 RepID=UPI0027E08031|nr:peptidoglycan-binding protein [Streptomyces sp. TRM72054]